MVNRQAGWPAFWAATFSTILFIYLVGGGTKISWFSAVIFWVLSFSISYLIFQYFLNVYIRRIVEDVVPLPEDMVTDHQLEEKTRFPFFHTHQLEHWLKKRKEITGQFSKLVKHRREFLGNVSHELKTPVFNIQGYISTLVEGGIQDPLLQKTYLQRAENNVERLINIIEDLEDINQLETGFIRLHKENFDFITLCQETCEALELLARQRKIGLVIWNPKDAQVYVHADKNRIRQVMTNLIVNSIKYGKEGGTTRIQLRIQSDRVVVEVKDNGIGIAAVHLPRIFERFYRVDKSRSREQGGTGLGLSIVKHITEAHGYPVEVLSAEGVGSTFTFALDIAEQ